MSVLYFVRAKYRSKGAGSLGTWLDYFYERDYENLTRENTILDILAGQVDHVTQILAVDLETSQAYDATEEIAREVFKRVPLHDPVTRELYEFVEQHVGIIPAQELTIETGLL